MSLYICDALGQDNSILTVPIYCVFFFFLCTVNCRNLMTGNEQDVRRYGCEEFAVFRFALDYLNTEQAFKKEKHQKIITTIYYHSSYKLCC